MTPGRSRMPGTPNLSFSGGFVSPEDMGTREFNEYGRLAGAIGHAGEAQSQWAQRKYNERAEADSLVALNSTMKAKGEERNRLMLLQGNDAKNAPQAYQDYAKKIDDNTLNSLNTPLAKEMYRRRMMDYDRQASGSIDAHALQEDAKYKQTALAASIDGEINNASEFAGNGMAFAGAVQRIQDYSAKLYQGQPPEYIDLQNQKYASLAIEGTAATLAQAGSPQKALEFLNSGVEELLNDKSLTTKFAMLRKKYEESADNSEVATIAMSLVDSEMEPDEIMRQAYAKYPDDMKKAQQLINIADVYRSKKTDTANLKAVQYKSQAWDAVAKGGYALEAIPPEVATSNPALYKEMVEHIAWRNKMGNEKLDPNYGELDKLEAMQPSELRAWLEKPGNYDKLSRYAGDDKDAFTRIRRHSFAQDGSKSGTGAGGGGLDVNDWFENNYGAMYEQGLLFKGPATYDPKSEEAKQRSNGFRVRYEDRAKQKEAEVKRKLTYDEQKEVVFGIIKDVRAGRVKLESSFYDEMNVMESAPLQMPVTKTELPPAQAVLNRGENAIAITEPGTKEAKNFGVIQPGSSEMFADVAAINPDQTLRAYDRGIMSGLSYEPDDYIVKKGGITIVYGPDWKYKGADMTEAVRNNMERSALSYIQQRMASKPPLKSKPMRDLREKYGDRMVEKKTKNGTTIATPDSIVLFDAMGNQTDTILNIDMFGNPTPPAVE